MRMKAICPTWLKKRNEPAKDLSQQHKLFVPPGMIYSIEQQEGSLVALDRAGQWWINLEHWEIRQDLLTSVEIEILAKTIYGEARKETHDVRLAIAWTILNRVRSKNWRGESVVDVCQYPFDYPSWHKEKELLLSLKKENGDKQYLLIYQMIESLADGKYTDPTNGCTTYCLHTKRMPKWTVPLEAEVKIGRYLFFKLNV